MKSFQELGARQCRYPVTDDAPFMFCGAVTDGRSYCPEHDELCHAGPGKDWQGLAGMIDATEQTVAHMRPKETDLMTPADEVLAEAAEHFDEPGGLMRRT